MREHPLTTALRFWLCFLLLCWQWPEAAMGVCPMLFMPVLSAAICCTSCNAGTCHQQYQIVITNTTNRTCTNCASYNATWTVSVVSDCVWEYTTSGACGETKLKMFLDALNNNLEITFTDGVTTYAHYRKNNPGLNCGYSGLSASGIGLDACDTTTSPATAVVTAV